MTGWHKFTLENGKIVWVRFASHYQNETDYLVRVNLAVDRSQRITLCDDGSAPPVRYGFVSDVPVTHSEALEAVEAYRAKDAEEFAAWRVANAHVCLPRD
jgi:hypothetical protein